MDVFAALPIETATLDACEVPREGGWTAWEAPCLPIVAR
jgi:hypothetical protein